MNLSEQDSLAGVECSAGGRPCLEAVQGAWGGASPDSARTEDILIWEQLSVRDELVEPRTGMRAPYALRQAQGEQMMAEGS